MHKPDYVLICSLVAMTVVMAACGGPEPTPTTTALAISTSTPQVSEPVAIIDPTPGSGKSDISSLRATPASIPSPLPTETLATTPPPISGDTGPSGLDRLILRPTDILDSLTLAASDKSVPNSYSVIYVHPEAVANQGDFLGQIIAVIANLKAADDSLAVQRLFVDQGSLSAGAVVDNIVAAEADATDVRAEELAAKVANVDRQLVFRVTYTLRGDRLHEYRYRFIVGEVVANVIVTARALESGSESVGLRAKSLELVRNQVQRLLEADD